MTDILATLVLLAFLLSAVLFIRPDERRIRSSVEGFVFAAVGGLLFLVLCADRVIFTSDDPTPWRETLDVLPGSATTGFRSPSWVVWFVAVGYLVRALMFSRLQERFHVVTKENGTLASYVTFAIIVGELLAQAYRWPLAVHLAAMAVALSLYYLPVVQVVRDVAVRTPDLLSAVVPRVLKDFGAYVGLLFAKLVKLRGRFVRRADAFAAWLDRLLDDAKRRKPPDVEKTLGGFETALQKQELKRKGRGT